MVRASDADAPRVIALGERPATGVTTRPPNGEDVLALVQLANVSKVYRSPRGSDYEAVRGFSLDIEPGDFFCLLGTSGCGKTTRPQHGRGLRSAPRQGDIRIGGAAIDGAGRGPRRRLPGRPTRSIRGSPRSAMSSSACACAGSVRREREANGPALLELVGLTGQEHKASGRSCPAA